MKGFSRRGLCCQVVELFRVHGGQYAALLRGCVEMGVRVLVERAEGRVQVAEVPSHPPGTACLAGRKALYPEKDRRAHDVRIPAIVISHSDGS